MEASAPDTAWYRDSGFGMFIHWGPYAQLAGRWQGLERDKDLWAEWALHRTPIPAADYQAMARGFQPQAFDADAWATVASEAGMGWMVLTAKHHDGFAMYRSAASAYNLLDHAGFPRDPLAELATAARRAGLRFGAYYSHKIDWHHHAEKEPDGFARYFDAVCLPQVRELLTGYGTMDVLWFDIGVDQPYAERLLDLVRGLQPQTLVSGRIGGGLGDFICTSDCEIPATTPAGAWETCMTLGLHWAWYPQDTYQKSAAEVVRMLAQVRSQGGCLLLNVGPDRDGRLPPRELAVLRQVGAWMRTNAASVRGVTASPLAPLPWGYATRAGDRLYLHLAEWPASGRLIVPGVAGAPSACWLLADPDRRPLAVRSRGPDLEITLDAATIPLGVIDPLGTVVVLDLASGVRFDRTLRLDDDWPNHLRPDHAEAAPGTVICNERSIALRETDPANEFPRYDAWADLAPAGSGLAWTVRGAEPGDYHVLMSAAADGDGAGQAEVVAGGTRLAAPVRVGPWPDPDRRFLLQRLGTVSLAAGAQVRIALSLAAVAPGRKVLVQGLTLVPTRTTPLR